MWTRKSFTRGHVLLCWVCISTVVCQTGAIARGSSFTHFQFSAVKIGAAVSKGGSKQGRKSGGGGATLHLDQEKLVIKTSGTKKVKLADPPPMQRPSAPTIPLPPPPGRSPECCTICPRKFYQRLALLQLPADVEQETLQRFHKAYDLHRQSPVTVGTALKKADRKSFLETKSSRFSRSAALPKVHRPCLDSDGEPSIDPVKSAGLGWFRADKAMLKSGGKQGRGSKHDSVRLGCTDVLTRLEKDTLKSSQIPSSEKQQFKGQRGIGACCNICPTWFVPHNHQKVWSRNRPGITDQGIEVDQPEKGLGQVKKTPVVPSVFMQTGERSKSAWHANGGFSYCCPVCIDPGPEGGGDAGKSSFLEEKVKIIASLESHQKDSALMKQKLFLRAMEKTKTSAPPRPGMCCYMCNAAADSGWPGGAPFEEPMSEKQSEMSQSTSEDNMRKIAYYRTYHHAATVDDDFRWKGDKAGQGLNAAADALITGDANGLMRMRL